VLAGSGLNTGLRARLRQLAAVKRTSMTRSAFPNLTRIIFICSLPETPFAAIPPRKPLYYTQLAGKYQKKTRGEQLQVLSASLSESGVG
jgi:hypothetical protein